MIFVCVRFAFGCRSTKINLFDEKKIEMEREREGDVIVRLHEFLEQLIDCS